jgi:hypothetical protein
MLLVIEKQKLRNERTKNTKTQMPTTLIIQKKSVQNRDRLVLGVKINKTQSIFLLKLSN